MSKRLDEIRARCEAATPGPWYVEEHRDYSHLVAGKSDSDDAMWLAYFGLAYAQNEAAFCAHARADLPALLAVAEAAAAYRETVDDFDALTQSRCPDDYEYENWQRAQLAIANGYDALMAALEALEAQR